MLDVKSIADEADVIISGFALHQCVSWSAFLLMRVIVV